MYSERKRPAYYIHENGLIMPSGFPVENFTSALNYKPDPGDTFIVTYPKCGTTWAQYILYLLLNKGVPLEPGKNIHDFIPHLEEVGKENMTAFPQPRIIKTHLPFSLTPYDSRTKYIYIARNPKDCCVSFYHHTKGFPRLYKFLDGQFDDFFEVFLSGEVDFGDYFDHLLSWTARKDDENVLFLLYEEMKQDTAQSIKKIAKFLGGPYEESCSDNNIFDLVLRHSGIDAMKKTPEAWSSKRPEGTADFIRKGVIGDWKNYFSKEQAQKLEAKFGEKLGGTTAEHLWDEYGC